MVRNAFLVLAAIGGSAALAFAISTNAASIHVNPKGGRMVTHPPKGAKLVVRSHSECVEVGCASPSGNGTCLIGWICEPTPEGVICNAVYGPCK
jgi:hypothetical protein